jgi:hypothetical protein
MLCPAQAGRHPPSRLPGADQLLTQPADAVRTGEHRQPRVCRCGHHSRTTAVGSRERNQPAVLAHLVAVAQARMGDRGTVHAQPAGTGQYVITACRDDRDLVMMFARRHRDWVLTAAGMITGGQPQAISCRTAAGALRLLGGQNPGPVSPPQCGRRGCRATALSRPTRTPSCSCEPTRSVRRRRLAAS